MQTKTNITMKKIILFFAAVAMSVVVASAQDINQATENYNNGAMELQMGNNSAALDYFKTALEMGEALGDEGTDLVNNCKKAICSAHIGMAKDLYNAKDFAAAAEAFAEAKTIAEGYGEVDLAAEAEDLIGQANLQVYNTAGKDAMREKNYPAAIENFNKVLEIDPENGAIALQLGQAYMRGNNLDEAVTALEKAKELGQAENANKLLSQVYLKQAQNANKAKDYQGMLDLCVKSNECLENANAYKLAASAAQKLNQSSDVVIGYYEKYLEVSPNAKDANGVICTIAVLYQQAGNKEKAKEYYTKIENDPQYGATAKEQLKVL